MKGERDVNETYWISIRSRVQKMSLLAFLNRWKLLSSKAKSFFFFKSLPGMENGLPAPSGCVFSLVYVHHNPPAPKPPPHPPFSVSPLTEPCLQVTANLETRSVDFSEGINK